MIKVTMISNSGRATAMASNNATIRQVLEENHVNYSVGVTSIDGCPLGAGDIDKTFSDMGIAEKCYLSVVVKADNAAKVNIVGGAVVVTSAVKLEDLKSVKKFKPSALQLWEGEGDERDLVCQIMLDEEGIGEVDNNGIVYGGHTNEQGYATATVFLRPEDDDPGKVVEDELGGMLIHLKKLEDTLPEVLSAITRDKETVRGMITRA